MMLPANLAGRSFLDLLLLYAHQKIIPFPALTLGATNIYQWLPGAPFGPFFRAGLVLAAVIAVVFMITVARRFPEGMSGGALLHGSLLSLVLMPFVLPAMHERYFFAADALSVPYAFTFRGGWRVAALIQLASACTYCPYLFDWEPVPRPVLAVFMGAAVGRLWCGVGVRARPISAGRSLAGGEVDV